MRGLVSADCLTQKVREVCNKESERCGHVHNARFRPQQPRAWAAWCAGWTFSRQALGEPNSNDLCQTNTNNNGNKEKRLSKFRISRVAVRSRLHRGANLFSVLWLQHLPYLGMSSKEKGQQRVLEMSCLLPREAHPDWCDLVIWLSLGRDSPEHSTEHSSSQAWAWARVYIRKAGRPLP